MTRGTTPTVTIVPDTDLSQLKNIYITFSQGSKVVTKTNSDMIIDLTAGSIAITFSQEETLLWKAVASVAVQLRATTLSGDAVASEVAYVSVSDILMDGVIA